MGNDSKIQWTGHTWNPWHGCKKVSQGCRYCYMYRDKERYGQDPTTVLRSKTKFNEPLQWKDPALVFTCSWSDWFIQEADAWRLEAWDIIKRTPHLTYQILTKRPERILAMLPHDWGEGYPNVWLGVSVENQDAANERIPILLQVPAVVHFLSCEPLLGPRKLQNINAPGDVENEGWKINCLETGDVYTMHSDGDTGGLMPGDGPMRENAIDWVIIGGESGHETGKYTYRPAQINWFFDIIDQCRRNEIPVFMKQTGTFLAKELGLKDRHGGDIDEWLLQIRKREFPACYKPTQLKAESAGWLEDDKKQ